MLDRLKTPRGVKKRAKIVGRGRGTGLGKTSGRGNKGQNARASGGVRPGFEGGQMPLIRRVPKRGFTWSSPVQYQIVSVEDLNRFAAGSEVTPQVLEKARLVRRLKREEPIVKILGDGDLKHALTVCAHAFSETAAEKIRKAGGTTRQLDRKAPSKSVSGAA